MILPYLEPALTRLNIVLSSLTVLIAFSLAAYLFVYNFRSAVARSFVLLLALVALVFTGDVFLSTTRMPADSPATLFWLRFQWLGIAFVAPAFLHFGDLLLASTGDRSRRRRLAIGLAYLLATLVLVDALVGDGMVGPPNGRPGALHLMAGPHFMGFALSYLGLNAWGVASLWRARGRTLTSRSHRRMSYLLVSIVVPVATFPWLMLGGGGLTEHALLFGLSVSLANLATAAMMLVVAYSVAYQGALIPDRAVKRELIKYLIQAPVLGGFVLATIQLIPKRLETSLGLPRDLLFMLMTVFGIVSYQLVVRALKPLIDQLIYGDVGRDAIWLRRLDERLVTGEDLSQLLENILAAMCDRLRVTTGCVVIFEGGRPRSDIFTGDGERTAALLAALEAEQLQAITGDTTFAVLEGFWVHPLRPPDGGGALGLLAIEDPGRALDPVDEADFRALIGSAEKALQDRIIQQRVLDALRALEPELVGIQRLRGALERPNSGESLGSIGERLTDDPEFASWVKDALSHYWGGPKLTESPLLGLEVVRDALSRYDHNSAKAMREVLDHALERLRPEGERSMTGSQWLVYNILELKFVRGLKVRDIAQRLALSESDLYRKQRVAIDALADQLAAMEPERSDSESLEPEAAREPGA
ncbi:MAG: hypothetical protein KDH92_01980 [Chloroflexi bacterium]|nr:hypothetical protein [Chloroflexota bacterium]